MMIACKNCLPGYSRPWINAVLFINLYKCQPFRAAVNEDIWPKGVSDKTENNLYLHLVSGRKKKNNRKPTNHTTNKQTKTPNNKPLWIGSGRNNRWCITLQASITLSDNHGGYFDLLCIRSVIQTTLKRKWPTGLELESRNRWLSPMSRQEHEGRSIFQLTEVIDNPYTEKIWSWNKYRLSRVTILSLTVDSSN